MIVEPKVDPEIQRIQPNPAPAIVIRTPCCQSYPYCGRCSKPNPSAERNMPGTTPSERMNSGCMKPRNANSSHNGPTVTPAIATIHSETRSLSSSRIGPGASGVRSNAPRIAMANAIEDPSATIDTGLYLGLRHPNE